MNFCGIEVTETQQVAIALGAYAFASEAIGMSRLKDNTVLNFIMTVLGSTLRAATPADTPKRSTSSPRGGSPAPRKQVRPTKPRTSSRTAPK